ncbi:MAG: pili assembly chaperone [Acidobacteria bacterium]|nr:MAG: pili assembly chaperone [Acidobacteriota bacterium]
MKKGTQGFSLIELLIVVAIILIIAAIAIPNLLKSRMAANQASAVASLRTINTGEVTYASTYTSGYSADLVSLGPASSGAGTAASAGLLDSVLAAGAKSGYSFTYAATSDGSGHYTTYTVNANPSTAGTTGSNYYFTDQTNVIRQNSTQQAASSDSPLGG